MLDDFERKKVLTNLNQGFRSGYSCETQLAVTMDEYYCFRTFPGAKSNFVPKSVPIDFEMAEKNANKLTNRQKFSNLYK